jgi:transcriptional regulator with XRE-family HTH domain
MGMQRKADPVLVETIRSRIRQRMSELGLTQAELADGAAVRRSAVNEVLKKERLPGCDLLMKLARTLGVSLDYLVGSPGSETDLDDELSQLLMMAIASFDPESKKRLLSFAEDLLREKAKTTHDQQSSQ